MLTLRKVGLAAALVALAGCATEVRNADVQPGGTVTTVDRTQNAMIGWMEVFPDNKAPGVEHWTRIRVVAPAGATECRSGNGIFSRGGPQDEARPDASRVVMLTTRSSDRKAHFVCDTPSGPVRRSVEASVYTMPVPPNVPEHAKWLYDDPRSYHVLPPLVHMDPKDPEAEARWAALGVELCPEVSHKVYGFVCKPDMLAKFKAVDLGDAAG